MRNAWNNFLQLCETLGATLLLVTALIFSVDVIGRYAFGVTKSWIIDLEWYLAAISICLSLGPALAKDIHVRVDVLRIRFSESWKRSIDLAGHLLLLLPWCAFIIWSSSRYAFNSYLIGEGSPDPGGLPYRWLIKAVIPIGFFILALEGIRRIIALIRRPEVKQ